MATTSLWHIAGRLKDLIDYVENPEKTLAAFPDLEDLWNAARYVQRPAATADGQYVTAINCLKETAIEQMILTKKQYGKGDGYIAYHGYQSFKPGEVTAQECHDIGVETAREMWGDRFQVLVATHLDHDHLHNHFCLNSVSFRDGRKYNYSNAERQRLRDVSDRICQEHGLSIIENPHKAPPRPVYFREKDGKPTRYNIYWNDVFDAIENNNSPRMVEKYLNALGYITDFTGAHWKIRLPQYQHFTRLDTLDERLTPQWIAQNCGRCASFGNQKAEISHSPDLPRELESAWRPYCKTTHIYRLYLYWCYELGILPKGTTYKPTSPFLREELAKLDQYDRETRFLAGSGIETITELQEAMEKAKAKLNTLTDERNHLTYQMRRAIPERKKELHEEKAELTKQITELRNKIKMMDNIARRSGYIDQCLERVYESEVRAFELQHDRRRERTYER